METRSGKKAPILRREKVDACADFWHTLQVGVPVAVVLFFVLPILFHYLLN